MATGQKRGRSARVIAGAVAVGRGLIVGEAGEDEQIVLDTLERFEDVGQLEVATQSWGSNPPCSRRWECKRRPSAGAARFSFAWPAEPRLGAGAPWLRAVARPTAVPGLLKSGGAEFPRFFHRRWAGDCG